MQFWTLRSGSELATLEERTTINFALPVNGRYLPLANSGMKISIVSGSLPRGLRLVGADVVGTPFEVSTDTVYTFVVRADLYGQIQDRTYKFIVVGSDEPQWLTAQDLLPVGPNNTYFIVDSAPLDFQLSAIDNDIPTGQKLEYFIQPGDGELPPGITLTTDGKLVGIVEPILALEKAASEGKYDDNNFGSYPYDFAVRSGNGFDSFFYDTGQYDISVPTNSPKKLNRFYEFRVSVSDGDTVVKRQFRIYVVGDDFLRSDNTIMQVANGIFSADNSNIRVPIWLTPADFGFRRANNYVTLFLDVIDPNSINGIITYSLDAKNDDNSISLLPEGLSLDVISGEITGRVPYQPAITKEYKFTVRATRTVPDSDVIDLTTFAFADAPSGSGNININSLGQYTDELIGRSFEYLGQAYQILSVNTTESTSYDVLQLDRALVNAIPITTSLNFGKYTISGVEQAEKAKTFTVKMLGEIDSVLTWNTVSDLGTISSNYVSTLGISATSTVPNSNLLYSLQSGELPPGLKLSYDGQIIGKINSFGSSTLSGLTIIDTQNFTLDNNTTTLDRKYSFEVKVQDHFGYSAITKTFTVTVTDPDDKLYSNIFMRPFLKQQDRSDYSLLLSDNNIFPNEYIYRPNDPNFGIQKQMQMLVYAGIETKGIAEYVAASAKNHIRKKYKLGAVNYAVAKTPGTNDIVYEVVYIDVIDPAEPKIGKTHKKFKITTQNKILANTVDYNLSNDSVENIDNSYIEVLLRNGNTKRYFYANKLDIDLRTQNVLIDATETLPVGVRNAVDVQSSLFRGNTDPFRFRPNPTNTIKIDSDAITVDGSNDTIKYISNIQNMRDNIRSIGATEINFLPLWMRSTQPGSTALLGFKNAIPICYCKPGTAKEILSAIKNNNVSFQKYNFDIDRYVIDSTTGKSEEQYILFANYVFNT